MRGSAAQVSLPKLPVATIFLSFAQSQSTVMNSFTHSHSYLTHLAVVVQC